MSTPEQKLKALGAQVIEAKRARPAPANDEPTKPKFVLEHIGGLKYDPDSAEWLIRDLLPAQGLATIYGKPKSYKSFVAIDAALAMARRLDTWANREIEGGAVVYIACEGAAGVRKRIAAYLDYHGIVRADFPFFFVDAKPNLGIAEGDAEALGDAIAATCEAAGVKPVAVFVDTLARTLHGASENGEGMGAFCDNAEAVGSRFNCLAVAVHHTPHEGDRMRGNSVLLGSVVSSWRVEKVEGLAARVTIDAIKDGEEGQTWTIQLARHSFATNKYGYDVSSLVASDTGTPSFDDDRPNKQLSARVPPSLRAFMSAFERALDGHGKLIRPGQEWPELRAVSEDAVREEYRKACVIEADKKGQELKDGTFRSDKSRALKAALDREALIMRAVEGLGNMLWKPTA